MLTTEAIQKAMAEVAPNVASWNKTGVNIYTGELGSCKLFDSSGKQIINPNDPKGEFLIDVPSQLKILLAEHGMSIGYSSVTFDKIPGTSLYNLTPSTITFKSNPLTGSQSDDDRYVYHVASGQLDHYPAPPKVQIP